ncbi:aminotransferase class IV family protein [Roseovarius salis]|uniref:aminotransferase class IV family protein n=1 Tax=Roseovarius salis TaxID=3376063 RepID=UPI0037C8F53B
MENTLRPPADPGFRLIETCLWTPGAGVHLRDRHLARLHRSAVALGITPHAPGAWLDAVRGTGPLRLRLTVAPDGAVTLKTVPFTPLPDGTVWRLGLASERLASGDPWRRHKTTERAVYDRARQSMPANVDEVLFVNERGELCEGTITNLFVDFGHGMVTPPVACGVLPGVLREDLLARGMAREEILTPAHLRAARALYVGNALRGLIPATMA